MSCKSFCISVFTVLLTASAFSAQERVIHVQNRVRVGYDDNVHLNTTEQDSMEIIDVLTVSGKLRFSSRSDAVFSFQPEIRYRPDVDPKELVYQDIYVKLNHALSQRVFLTLSDRFRYQERDAQSGGVNAFDQNFQENDLLGSLNFTLDSLSSIRIGGGYTVRIWDDNVYGEDRGNDYDKYRSSLSYFREISRDTTTGMLGVDFSSVDYDGSRGAADTVTLMSGADTVFNPNLTGFGRLGASLSSADTVSGSKDQTTPYVSAGMEYHRTKRTSFSGNVDYSVYEAQNSLYNQQDRFSIGAGVRHDLTAKINVAGSLSYTLGQYDGRLATPFGTEGLSVDDKWVRFSLRASYQINRNNYAEFGYEYMDREVDNSAGALTEFARNRFDIGWRLRL